MSNSAKNLLQLAKDNPWWLFTAEELASLMNLSVSTLEMIKRAPNTPFVTGKTRPENVMRWLSSNKGWKPSQER